MLELGPEPMTEEYQYITAALIPDIPLICMLVAQFRGRLATAHGSRTAEASELA